ncbi:uncharacterized protein LOC130955346 [Arachis stenosperma]|uniref:uncharacterized protein LOC130955346 n=1 Tax=Arachis stenosperma TaxID=217475 RepID=UPI0025AC8D30|nr:uncharacterized protein LOC130955346 [Arachis stenosperma]
MARQAREGNSDSDGESDNEVLIEEEDIKKGKEACAKSLIGRVFADKKFSVGTIENAFRSIWSRPEGFRVSDRGGNNFQFFFDNDKDLMKIEKGSPWLFKDYVLHVRRWNNSDRREEREMQGFPVWAQFWGLPECYKTIEVGRKLAEKIGGVIEVGFYEMKGGESRIIKTRVEMDASKKLKDHVCVIGPNHQAVEIGVRYEKLGRFCTYCARLGHEPKGCELLDTDSVMKSVRQDKIGDWIKAYQMGRRINNEFNGYNVPGANLNDQGDKPKKKPIPSWLLNSLSGLSMKETVGAKLAPEVNSSHSKSDSLLETSEANLVDITSASTKEPQEGVQGLMAVEEVQNVDQSYSPRKE